MRAPTDCVTRCPVAADDMPRALRRAAKKASSKWGVVQDALGRGMKGTANTFGRLGERISSVTSIGAGALVRPLEMRATFSTRRHSQQSLRRRQQQGLRYMVCTREERGEG